MAASVKSGISSTDESSGTSPAGTAAWDVSSASTLEVVGDAADAGWVIFRDVTRSRNLVL